MKQLGVDYIDILSFQWPERYKPIFGDRDYDFDEEKSEREMTPIFDQLETIQELVKCGKIRAFGLSNESPYGLTKFSTMAELMNLPRPCLTTHPYNLLNRCEVEHGNIIYVYCYYSY